MSQVESAPLSWRKSSRCDSGACVEVARQDSGVAVRNNTLPELHLTFDAASWRGLLQDLRDGQLTCG
jgi:hypothetical protein